MRMIEFALSFYYQQWGLLHDAELFLGVRMFELSVLGVINKYCLLDSNVHFYLDNVCPDLRIIWTDLVK